MIRVLRAEIFLLALVCAVVSHAQDTVKACAVLRAEHMKNHGGEATDTARIQSALSECSPGKAVVLETSGTKDAFISAPLLLPRSVTLFIGHDVTLYASQNLRDYDLRPGSCGNPDVKQPGCKPFLFAYQAAFSGVAGDGTIDGQNDRTIWWRIREQSKTPAHEGNAQYVVPDLIASYESQNFSVRGVHLKDAAGDSIAIYKTTGFRADALEITSPKGGDGILLSNSPDASLTGLNIRVGDAAVDVRASILGGTSLVNISGLRVKGGKGIVFGDPQYGDVHTVRISHAILESTGLKFDLRGAHGGVLRNVQFEDVCLSGISAPLMVQSKNGTPNVLPPEQSVQFNTVVVRGRGLLTRDGVQADSGAICSEAPQPVTTISWSVDTRVITRPEVRSSLVVAQDSSGDFHSIQEAIDALPRTGGEIAVRPGIYREVVTIRKPHVHLYGEDKDPQKTEIVFNNTGPRNGGTFNSATVFVEADNDSISNMTIANDAGSGKGQAVALAVTGDRAIFRNLRILGAQDTLFAASRYCYGDYGPCVPARQYFHDCYIAGNVDFIFGDAIAVFDHCELHGIPGRVMYTAQGRHTVEQQSAYVFDHCRLTADPKSQTVSLGRPWRPYATVVYLHTQMDAPVIPAGWTEWPRFGVPSLPTAYYAEFGSTGPGAIPNAREPYSHQLTAAEAAQWSPHKLLAGQDRWDPLQEH